jgi:CBS domain-containing protein
MICPSCHTENIPGAEYCESCGSDLHDLAHPEAEDEFSKHILTDVIGDVEADSPPPVAPGDPVGLVIHQMQENGVSAVLVKDDGKLVGILTERDVLLKAAGDDMDLNALAVRELMTADPVTLQEDDPLAVALHKMSVGGFRHIPIVEKGEATRIASVRDVVRHISPFIPHTSDV